MKMREAMTAKTTVCVMVCVLGWATVATADDAPSLSTDVSVAFMSKYVWRGQLLNDDYVMQPSVGFGYGNLSASLWGNVDMTDYSDNKWEFTEYDWAVGYADTIPGVDFLSYSVGAIYYHFPSSTASTTEVYVGLELDLPLSPTVTVYRDIDEIDGTYVAFSISHSVEKIFELSPEMPVGMTASASIGWGSDSYNKGYWSNPDDATKSVTSSSMQDLTLSVGFPVVIGGWTVTPSVSYATLLDKDVRAADTYATNSGTNGSDYLFTGVTLSKSF